MDTLAHERFAKLAKQELEEALSILPVEPMQKLVIFVEAVRVLDYWSVFQSVLPKEYRLSWPDLTIIRWGWNLAVEHLYTSVPVPGAFPISESTSESRDFATSLLHKLGRSVLLHRASEMIRYGSLEVEKTDMGFTIKMSKSARNQFLDDIEFFSLDEMESTLSNIDVNNQNGWQLFDVDDYSEIEKHFGNFWGRPPKKPSGKNKVENIDELMTPLVFPWDSGHGIMMGYDALPEIDEHFLAQALELTIKWREEAGLHPETLFDELGGGDLSAIIAFVTSLHLKHVRFALLAGQKFPEISVPQSLTIWEPHVELEAAIADYTNIDRNLVRKALDAITMQPEDVVHLHGVTKLFNPLLIGLGNGVILKPVSSLARNPFLSTITLLEWRKPTSKDEISRHREDWMRSQIYGMFRGARYRRVEGNIKIRDGNEIVTDIDAAVLDVLTGEIALFQIKWQDYFTNDVRELRSKASNLSKELDEWSDKVMRWIHQRGHHELIKTLRLKLDRKASITSIYLFGISRTYARTQGFGFATKNKNLAVTNWPQFLRARFEIGPAERVIQQLFNKLSNEMHQTPPPILPLPVTIKAGGEIIVFEDLWNGYGDEDE